ncbi:hypothetical protein Tel_09490 [Candidatus Tenderia electrophaga]|jgi:uncharacterized protein|uniref:Large ribosomal RNA subunit accumulation protein YceD n=1 Tax=Candidatus Tenderia electrophaga TaxID=1748243 RepID=A0A0S2TDX9_9GAMM|nr:hypothetical protein Tel_09490 [Candidatus Tenderia electrophaga]
MSPQHLPVQIAPFRLARQGQVLAGTLELTGMARLAEAVVDVAGDAGVQLQFGIDEQGTHYAKGHLSAQVERVCQRCLQTVTERIESDVALGFVASDEQARKLAPDYEPCMVGSEPIQLADLVEDELILALPIVALHEDACEPFLERLHSEAEQSDRTQDKPNPFAVLAELKGKKQ